MKAIRLLSTTAIFLGALFVVGPALAEDSENRKELKRIDLSGSPEMEVISSISEYKPGEVVGRHFHHGVESELVTVRFCHPHADCHHHA